MKTTSSAIASRPKRARDYISVIQNAAELFELYTVNIQLEILKTELNKKREAGCDNATIIEEITLVCELQEICRKRV